MLWQPSYGGEPVEGLRAGRALVHVSRGGYDGLFAESVVLLTEHDASGSVGTPPASVIRITPSFILYPIHRANSEIHSKPPDIGHFHNGCLGTKQFSHATGIAFLIFGDTVVSALRNQKLLGWQ